MNRAGLASKPRTPAEESASRIAVVAALSATTMLFASLASAYLVRRSFEDWRPTAPLWPFVLLALGIGASGAMEIAVRSSARGCRQAFGGLVAASALYLIAALVVIVSIFQGESGLTRPHDAFIALLLGVHVLHAILGGGFAVAALHKAEDDASENALFLVRLVTHFLTAALMGILFLLFVLR